MIELFLAAALLQEPVCTKGNCLPAATVMESVQPTTNSRQAVVARKPFLQRLFPRLRARRN